MIAIYYLLKAIGLTQSLFGLILAYSAGAGMGFQVPKGFFDVIPSSLVESAKLDGCSNFKIFVRIILPLSKPIIIYQLLMAFTGPWMDFIFAKVIMGELNDEKWTVSAGLYSILLKHSSLNSLQDVYVLVYLSYCYLCSYKNTMSKVLQQVLLKVNIKTLNRLDINLSNLFFCFIEVFHIFR